MSTQACRNSRLRTRRGANPGRQLLVAKLLFQLLERQLYRRGSRTSQEDPARADLNYSLGRLLFALVPGRRQSVDRTFHDIISNEGKPLTNPFASGLTLISLYARC